MMRATLLALALPALLAAGCGSTPEERRVAAELPNDPVVAECRQEARRDPSVRNVWREMNPSNRTQEDRLTAMAVEAESNAFDACLRRRGVIRSGGVERVRPQGFYW
ncbi:phosphoribosylamine--glycine ligase [Falsiroseomonas bella]|uniref:Phosphoribosylamine--glycine ligase n=1 Tax=Falsiroseomonas bella TaxID=2184016 RepID=A0A317FLD0_9PROT|nr:phosphoribosylamine--glycine ligase [Falsiroseomonas bella]PWS38388.1 phosphoribosylamine--glycine ligase [Falsiroseomonas bella]